MQTKKLKLNNNSAIFQNKDDDFWNDCVKEPHSLQNIKLSSIRSIISNSSYRISLKRKTPNIQKILDAEERKLERDNQAKVHCHTLYNQSLMKNEINKSLVDDNKKRLEAEELSLCTWKPKIIRNRSFDSKLKEYAHMQMYKRGSLHLQKHNDRINYVRAKSLEEIPLNYKPKLSLNTKLQNVFVKAQKTTTEADSNQLFLFRYHKAREDEEYKKKRLVTDLSKNVGKKWEKKRGGFMRSISSRDVYVVRQTLHDNLQDCEFNRNSLNE